MIALYGLYTHYELNTPHGDEFVILSVDIWPLRDSLDDIAAYRIRNLIPWRVTADDAPFLIAHGDSDPLVPFEQSELLHASLEKANVPAFFVRINGGGHGFHNPELQRHMRQFLGQCFQAMDNAISEQPITLSKGD